jgi:hypothetical protein
MNKQPVNHVQLVGIHLAIQCVNHASVEQYLEKWEHPNVQSAVVVMKRTMHALNV